MEASSNDGAAGGTQGKREKTLYYLAESTVIPVRSPTLPQKEGCITAFSPGGIKWVGLGQCNIG